jgi:catechol 2,3-dioxygenase-like lactoylglutathione lyase family enzyme
MSAPFVGLDHVQLAIPVGGEAEARRFYCGLLGMQEIAKPPALAARGGLWLQSGSVVIHLGVEAEFRPARKAHPALICASYPALVATLRAAGVEVRDDRELPGVERCHVADAFGNRIELIADRPRAAP